MVICMKPGRTRSSPRMRRCQAGAQVRSGESGLGPLSGRMGTSGPRPRSRGGTRRSHQHVALDRCDRDDLRPCRRRLLDVGCGVGRQDRRCVFHVDDLVGIDRRVPADHHADGVFGGDLDAGEVEQLAAPVRDRDLERPPLRSGSERAKASSPSLRRTTDSSSAAAPPARSSGAGSTAAMTSDGSRNSVRSSGSLFTALGSSFEAEHGVGHLVAAEQNVLDQVGR